jgi:hypothetical protein
MAAATPPTQTLTRFIDSLVKGWKAANPGNKAQPALSLPVYAIESTRVLIDSLLPAFAGNAKEQKDTLALLLQAFSGPLAGGETRRTDELLSGFLTNTGANPWALTKAQTRTLLETCFQQGLPRTLSNCLTHPNRPEQWDRLALFEHDIPLVHVAAMRGLATLKVTLDAGADAGVVHKTTPTLLRAGSGKHLALLLNDPRTHAHLDVMIGAMCERGHMPDFAERAAAVFDAMGRAGLLARLPEFLIPQLVPWPDVMKGGLAPRVPLVKAALSLSHPDLAPGWFAMPKMVGRKGCTRAGWPVGGWLCREAFPMPEGKNTADTNMALQLAFLDPKGNWGCRTEKGGAGVWPYLCLLAQPDPRYFLGQLGMGGSKTDGVQNVHFLTGPDLLQFWDAFEKAMDNGVRMPFATRLAILSRLQDPAWHLPGAPSDFHERLLALAEERSDNFHRYSSEEQRSLVHRAMLVSMEHQLPTEDRWKGWVGLIGKGWFRGGEAASVLDTFLARGGVHGWSEEWDKLAKGVASRIGKTKNGKPLLEKWRLSCAIDHAPAPRANRVRL